MKKTLIVSSLVCLAQMAVASTIVYSADEWTDSTSAGYATKYINLEEALSSDVSWSLTAEYTLNGLTMNQWGSAFLASGTNPLLEQANYKNTTAFQYYVGTSENGNGEGFQTLGFITENNDLKTYGASTNILANVGTATLEMSWDVETETLSWSISSNGADVASAEFIKSDYAASDSEITSLSYALNFTGNTPAALNTLTVTIVPEPTTASLGLLGVAALFLRRRR